MSGRLVGRFVPAIVDQVISSASSLLIIVVASHVLTVAELGIVSLVLLAQGIVLGMARAALGSSLALEVGRPESPPDLLARYITRSALWGVAATVFGLVAAFAVGVRIEWIMPVLVGMPALLIQDVLRVCLVAAGRAWRACATDGAWLAMSIVIVLYRLDDMSVSALFWANTFGVFAGLAFAFPLARASFSWSVARIHPKSGSLLTEYLAASVPVQAAYLSLPLLMSLAEVGLVRLALSMTSPLSNLLAVLRIQWLNGFARSESPREAMRHAVLLSFAVVGFMIAGAGLMWALPANVFGVALGETGLRARELLLLAFVYEGLRAATFPLVDLMRAKATGKAIVRIRVTTTLITVLGLCLGALGGPRPILVALIGTQIVALALYASGARAATEVRPAKC